MLRLNKKYLIISAYYLVAVIAVTLAVVYLGPVHNLAVSLFLFYLTSAIFAFLSGFYLFHTNGVDFHHKKGKIMAPLHRDISKRKVLFLAFLYSILFLLMFIYQQISFFVFAFWPVMVFLALLLFFDRRLIFNAPKDGKVTAGQKYGIRFLISLAVFSSMWYLNQFIILKPVPLHSDLVKDWEFIDISIWLLPLTLISGLIIADWITTAIRHEQDKNFFKRADVILFYGIQLLIILFVLLV